MKKILLAFDATESAQRALEMAADLAGKYEATITVVSVVPVHPGRAPVDPWDDAAVHDVELMKAAEALRAFGIQAELLRPMGSPAPTIERIASEGAFDVVVVGSRGLNTIERALQGSVSEHVATHADATVVVVR